MLAWGNGVGNEFYEYKLPSDFRRPKEDKDVEIFIRNKYDKKLYVHDNFDYAKSIKNHPSNSSPVPAPVNAPTSSVPVVPLKKSEVRLETDLSHGYRELYTCIMSSC